VRIKYEEFEIFIENPKDVELLFLLVDKIKKEKYFEQEKTMVKEIKKTKGRFKKCQYKKDPEMMEFLDWLQENKKEDRKTSLYVVRTIFYKKHNMPQLHQKKTYKHWLQRAENLYREFQKSKFYKRNERLISLIIENWGFSWFKLSDFVSTAGIRVQEAGNFLEHLVEKEEAEIKTEKSEKYYRLKEFNIKQHLKENYKILQETIR
jgi:hypothetical protein